MKNVILETRDGWRKKMAVPTAQPFVQVPVMSARDFALDRAEMSFDRDVHMRVMTFEWDGRETEDEVSYDGDYYNLEVLPVWREV